MVERPWSTGSGQLGRLGRWIGCVVRAVRLKGSGPALAMPPVPRVYGGEMIGPADRLDCFLEVGGDLVSWRSIRGESNRLRGVQPTREVRRASIYLVFSFSKRAPNTNTAIEPLNGGLMLRNLPGRQRKKRKTGEPRLCLEHSHHVATKPPMVTFSSSPFPTS